MSRTTVSSNSNFLKHPKGIFILFFTELWERFSYYGMRAILILFLVDNVARGGFGWSKEDAFTLLGTYTMMVYVMGIPGGIIADRYLGQKQAVLWGAILQCIGHFSLAFQSKGAFFVGLVALVVGVGLMKPSVSTMVGSLYEKGDKRRDGGFTIFYMGINIGGLIAPLVVGFIGEVYGWHYGFSLAGIGMLLGITTFLLGQKYFKEIGNKPQKALRVEKSHAPKLHNSFTKEEKDRLVVVAISFIAVFVFFMAFEQMSGLLNIYAYSYTNRYMGGWEIPASMLQSVNSIFVVGLAPLVAAFWFKIAKKHKNISSIYKIGVGNIIVGIGFLFMVGAALQKRYTFPEESALYWLIGSYFFQTLGELSLSPVSMSFITKVAPKHIVGSVMGILLAVIGVANFISSRLGRLAISLGDLTIFQFIFFVTVLTGALVIIFNKKLAKLTHGSEDIVEEDEEKEKLVHSVQEDLP